MVLQYTLEIDQVLLNVRVGSRNGKKDVVRRESGDLTIESSGDLWMIR
jgi:hypothetical protein